MVLFNPDFGLKGTLGIIERDKRQAFTDSFSPAYIFISLVREKKRSSSIGRDGQNRGGGDSRGR